jgi:hypothetical protein
MGVRVKRTTGLSVANSTATAVDFDSEVRDDGTFHSLASLTTRITMTTAGWYVFGGTVQWATNATGLRAVEVTLNGGSTSLCKTLVGAVSGTFYQTVTGAAYFALNDYIELVASQTSGGALNIVSDTGGPWFWAVAMRGH